MLKTDTCVINGATYSITQLPAMRGMRLFARVARFLGPALGKLGVSGQKAGGVSEEVLGAAVEALFERLAPDEFEAVLTEFFWSLKRDGRDVAPKASGSQFDLEMAGQLVTILQLVKFAFEVNFGNFTAAAAVKMAVLPAAAK